MDAPDFTHDCDRCTFLGNQEERDLYVCQNQETKQFTYIARYGNDGPDYESLSARVLTSLPPEPDYILWRALRAHQELLAVEERVEPHITF